MNPAAGVPLHFTVEALGLGVAGVILAWAALSRRWVIAAGGLLLAVAQIIYAGQFFSPDAAGSMAAGAIRIAGVVLIGAAGLAETGAPLVAGACVLVGAASVWRMAETAGPASLPWGQRATQ